MKNVVQVALVFSAVTLNAQASVQHKPEVIYGDDNRQEIFEATPFNQKLAASAATMISKTEMTTDATKPGLVQFNQRTLQGWLEAQEGDKHKLLFSKDVQQAAKVGLTFCADERFITQPNPGMCSGFLIAPDLIVTAGHCVAIEGMCEEYRWVFDFKVDPATKSAGIDVPAENIYKCKKIVSNSLNSLLSLDYGIIQLERIVTGREPLEIRQDSTIPDKTALLVIGSPSGLPLKVAAGANVRSNEHPFFFSANLDTFQGNSGSAVFNAKTGMVEGILVRGENDFNPNTEKMCVEAQKCKDDGCRGEDVSRMTSIPEVALQKVLFQAAEANDVEKLTTIIKFKIWVDFYGKDRQSALIKAAKAGSAAAIKLLVEKGADANLIDMNGDNALHHLATSHGGITSEALDALIVGKIDLNAKNNAGETALMLASKESVELLIKAGAKAP